MSRPPDTDVVHGQAGVDELQPGLREWGLGAGDAAGDRRGLNHLQLDVDARHFLRRPDGDRPRRRARRRARDSRSRRSRSSSEPAVSRRARARSFRRRRVAAARPRSGLSARHRRGDRVARRRADEVLAGHESREPVHAAIVGDGVAADRERPRAVLIRDAQRAHGRVERGIAELVEDGAGDHAPARHDQVDLLELLVGRRA